MNAVMTIEHEFDKGHKLCVVVFSCVLFVCVFVFVGLCEYAYGNQHDDPDDHYQGDEDFNDDEGCD